MKNLVYISAGDNSEIGRWIKDKKDFDLFVTYYGDNEFKFKNDVDFYNKRKGSKFQNLYYLYKDNPNILSQYDAVFVLDDDIKISTENINKLFKIREERDLWLLSPTFFWGRVSHFITYSSFFSSFRYVSFLEMNTPIFRREKLEDFLNVYDPELVGWGCDYWFLDVIGNDKEKNKIGISDDVVVINSYGQNSNDRSINKLQSEKDRIKSWLLIKETNKIKDIVHKNYSCEKKSFVSVIKKSIYICTTGILNPKEIKIFERLYRLYGFMKNIKD